MLTHKNSKHVTDHTYALRSQCTNQCTITNTIHCKLQTQIAMLIAEFAECLSVVNSEDNQSAVLSAVSCSRILDVLEQL